MRGKTSFRAQYVCAKPKRRGNGSCFTVDGPAGTREKRVLNIVSPYLKVRGNIVIGFYIMGPEAIYKRTWRNYFLVGFPAFFLHCGPTVILLGPWQLIFNRNRPLIFQKQDKLQYKSALFSLRAFPPPSFPIPLPSLLHLAVPSWKLSVLVLPES